MAITKVWIEEGSIVCNGIEEEVFDPKLPTGPECPNINQYFHPLDPGVTQDN